MPNWKPSKTMEQLEVEQLKLKLIELQIAVLQYQYRDSQDSIAALVQKKFDEKVDERDMPSGATTPPDAFTGD